MKELIICKGEGEPVIGGETFIYRSFGIGTGCHRYGKILDIYNDGDVLVELENEGQ